MIDPNEWGAAVPGTSLAKVHLKNGEPQDGSCRGLDPFSGPNCASCPVHLSGFCGGLHADEFHQLSARASTQFIPADSRLTVNNDRAQFAMVVAGFFRVSRHSVDGHRQIIGLICPGEPIEFSQVTKYVEIEAATEAQICRIHPASAAGLLMESHGFRRSVLWARQRMAERMREHAWALGRLNAAERIALFLVDSCGCMPWQPLPSGGGILTMRLSRADIADYLGTTAETLCRVIGALDNIGLIRVRDCRHFEIPDLALLGRFACIERPKGGDDVTAPTASMCQGRSEAIPRGGVQGGRG